MCVDQIDVHPKSFMLLTMFKQLCSYIILIPAGIMSIFIFYSFIILSNKKHIIFFFGTKTRKSQLIRITYAPTKDVLFKLSQNYYL